MEKRKRTNIITGIALFSGLFLYLLSFPLAQAQVHQHTPPAEGPKPPAAKAPPPRPEPAAEKPVPAKAELPVVEISPELQQRIGVKTTTVALRPLMKIIRTVGRIEYDEQKQGTVNTKFEGWVERLYVNTTGAYVKKGQPLVEIYSPELYATQLELISLLKWKSPQKEDSLGSMLAKDAQVIVDAAKQRLRLWDITEAQIKKIEETGKPVRTMVVYSPLSGYVTQKMAVQGMRVMPGEKLFDVVDLSSVWILADIYEYELPLIKVGAPAKISLSYFPGKEFSTRIEYVYPTMAGETRTARVRFSVPNPQGQLKPQMFTRVELNIPLGNKLAVPEEAVIDTGVRKVVYVDRGKGNFEAREIATGVKAEKMVEVLKGLKPGERVASSANFLIDSEAKLKGITPLPMR